jgi:hypothetical protein
MNYNDIKMPTTTKERLKKKLNKKKGLPDQDPEMDIQQMLSQANKMLKENPELVTTVNKCIKNLLGNQNFMEQIQAQTLESSSETVQVPAEAVSKQ